jgi:hypothetical protein
MPDQVTPIVTGTNLVQLPRQIPGNKKTLACQHDHLGLNKANCKADSSGAKGLGALGGKYGKRPF